MFNGLDDCGGIDTVRRKIIPRPVRKQLDEILNSAYHCCVCISCAFYWNRIGLEVGYHGININVYDDNETDEISPRIVSYDKYITSEVFNRRYGVWFIKSQNPIQKYTLLYVPVGTIIIDYRVN